MSEAKHARLGPSNHRWPHCPGSVREEERYPDIPGEAAIDGTGSHYLLECCLTHAVPANAYEGQVIGANHPDQPSGWLISKDRIERVQQCLDYVERRVLELRKKFPQATVEVFTETRSDPGAKYGRDDWWGTVDITIIASAGQIIYALEVVDYKDGREFVSAENNTQLISYTRGKIPDDGRFMGDQPKMTIVQPKTNPCVRSHEMIVGDVITASNSLAEAAARTDDPNAPLNPGNHCRWCKASQKRGGHCTAQSEQAAELIQTIPLPESTGGSQLFESISGTFGDITQLDSSKLVELADARPGIEAIFDKVDAEIQRRIEADPNAVPGYAMKPGKGSNVWNGDEADIVKTLKAKRLKQGDIFPSKLISPAQVMKLDQLTDKQKEDIKSKHILHVAGKLKLTRVREKEQPKVEELFADVANQSTDVPSFM